MRTAAVASSTFVRPLIALNSDAIKSAASAACSFVGVLYSRRINVFAPRCLVVCLAHFVVVFCDLTGCGSRIAIG